MTTFPQTPSTADSLARFVAGLPKAELHVHHVGSASPETVARLAERHAGDTRVPADPALLADYFTFTDFAHFIEGYLSVVDLVRDEDDVASLTYDIGVGLAAQQVRYAELTMTPYTSIVRVSRRRPTARPSRTPGCASPGTPASSCAGASTSRASPGCRPRRSRSRSRWACASTGWSRSAWAARRSASRARSSPPTSRRPGRKACTVLRTPGRPPARSRCGTRSTSSAPSASGTASRRHRTPY
ncbi:MAG: hypothetical protein U0R65_12460 [Candidatus Nanopelagicales bacterium]